MKVRTEELRLRSGVLGRFYQRAIRCACLAWFTPWESPPTVTLCGRRRDSWAAAFGATRTCAKCDEVRRLL